MTIEELAQNKKQKRQSATLESASIEPVADIDGDLF
jgi:hypothetical protein